MSDMSEAPRRGPSAPTAAKNFNLLAGVNIRLSVEVGSTLMTLAELAALDEGSVVALDRQTDEPLDICANGSRIARGEIVAVDGRYGIRITQLVSADSAYSGQERNP
ncbi:flagellar motor switch protein FliN [Sphingorhabdus pulchriflava]|uniref:Flagellar motor switch protein FliN n=1 Tax=Sphingorhabdus pulchriflava TaxID=2292257 RepID=A0A371B542_9SPHN|nr:flagellar motor switch protein FliN [Sphingorhabdus pulchriflava]RDV02699.1 flagellar motor switch protein FliN [Sphingorhabdus pulchriflava]